MGYVERREGEFCVGRLILFVAAALGGYMLNQTLVRGMKRPGETAAQSHLVKQALLEAAPASGGRPIL
jgi:hypothetical protein